MRFVLGHNAATVHRPEYREEDRGYDTPCWIWQRALNNRGYGRRTVGGREVLAHRHAYEQAHGPIPEDRELDHLCRQTACVRPDHLEPVRHATNMQRSANVRLSPEDVAEIRRLRAAGKTTSALANDYGTDRSNISKIARGLRWP